MDQTNELILNLKEQGKSLREIAGEVGISHVAVKKRLDRLVNPASDNLPVSETDGFSEPEKDDKDDDVVQRVWVSDFPAIERAYSELDEKLQAIEEMVREQLDLPRDKLLAFYTGNWKIEQRQVLTFTGGHFQIITNFSVCRKCPLKSG
jgi:hypothetical protein